MIYSQRRASWLIHLFYLLVISTLLFGLWGLNRMRINANEKVQKTEQLHRMAQEQAFSRLCGELAGDLYSAVEADSIRLYLGKLTEMQTATGQAMLLLEENGRQTPWITFWQSLETYLLRERDLLLDGAELSKDRKVMTELALVMTWLAENPAVLLDESTKSLPEGLVLPTLQTAYSVEEQETRRVAQRVLGIRDGLKEVENGPPGVRSYACSNARVDLLQSGELLYFNMQLKSRQGEIDDNTATQLFINFAKREGFGSVQIIDLYREDGLIRGKMVPFFHTGELGRVPDLDRTMEIACTSWSGRICYFSAGRYFTAVKGGGGGKLLSEAQLESLAVKRGARIGPPFRYLGKICRPLIYERSGWSGRSVLCIDATDGSGVDLFYLPHARVGERVLF